LLKLFCMQHREYQIRENRKSDELDNDFFHTVY
jgi:hypothetical protein